MMTHAYRETYLSKAQTVLGDAFDHAVNVLHIPGEDFVKLFTVSSFSSRMENGEPAVILGKSGIELVLDILFETTGKEIETEVKERYGRSEAYWIGWACAYCQWHSGRKYSEIFAALPYRDLQIMYPLHEADISKFTMIAEEKIEEHFRETSLKRLRTYYSCSQTKLAELSGASLRSIQMYEQRNKDINKAAAETLKRIADVLGCGIEDLLEH
ncbi:MAG: helix-turn-helix transcriptional regulator [Erysipelotrichaceae bacterium]|nr:helix-turn-helix transcriptional regulator [Erysipelotrichaceae bacterium]